MQTGDSRRGGDTVAEIHEAELRLLKAVAELCERHHIRYSLYCGTLLGAARHWGFIPWDDDVDLQMPLPDYRRFLRVAGELPEGMRVSYPGSRPDYQFWWTKVSLDGTTFMPKSQASLDVHWGVFIDIYPMIGEAGTRWGRKAQSAMLDTARKFCMGTRKYRDEKSTRRQRVTGLMTLPVRQPLVKLLFALALRSPDRSERCGTLDAAPFCGKYAREDWAESILMPFEGESFRCPARYDRILRTLYGDYMRLPPPQERRTHVLDDMIVDTHEDYRVYRGKLMEK